LQQIYVFKFKVGGSQSNIITSHKERGEGNSKINSNKNSSDINYRLYRRSNSVAGSKLLPQRLKPKMSVVGRMASIFVSDVNKQPLEHQQKGFQQRPTSWGALS
jgi:hypothetical protein